MFSAAFQANAFQNDAFQITITPTPTGRIGGDDAWTPEEQKRLKKLQKKIQTAENKRIEALKLNAENRKKAISDLIDPKPVAQTQQSNIQSNQEVSVDIPSNLAIIDQYLANLEKQYQDLFNAVQLRQAKQLLEVEMARLEAERKAEQEDEEALLLLI